MIDVFLWVIAGGIILGGTAVAILSIGLFIIDRRSQQWHDKEIERMISITTKNVEDEIAWCDDLLAKKKPKGKK